MAFNTDTGRAAAAARWANVDGEQRRESARRAARQRWNDGEDHSGSAATSERRKIARELPCARCGDPVGRAGRVRCAKAECRLANVADRAAARFAERARD